MATVVVVTGDELRAEREAANITQAQLASEMGTTQQYLSTIEGKAAVRAKTVKRYLAAVYAYTNGQKEGQS